MFRRLRQFALLFMVLTWCAPVHAFTNTQVKVNTACNSPCAVTVTSTGAHHLLGAGLIRLTANINIASVTAGACNVAWVHAPSTSVSGSVDIYYCTDSVSGQTSISITTGGTGTCGSTSCVGVIWEATPSVGGDVIALDSGATPSGGNTLTTCTSCAGVALTLSGNANDYVMALTQMNQSCTCAVTGTGFSLDFNPNGVAGVAHGIISASATAPATWTTTSGTGVVDAAAFQETSGASNVPFDKRRRYEQLED